MHMFCFQCQETGEGKGCTHTGECGKSEEAANLQDLLIFALKGIGILSDARCDAGGAIDRKIGMFVCNALFTTVTNTNFDPDRIHGFIARALAIKREIRARHADIVNGHGDSSSTKDNSLPEDECVVWDATDRAEIVKKAYEVGVEEAANLQDLLIYALKGIGILNDALFNTGGAIDRKIGMFVCHALFTTVTNTNFDPDRLHGVIARALAIKREIRARHADILNGHRDSSSTKDKSLPEDECVVWDSTDRAEIVKKAYEVGVLSTPNEDIRSLREMITYALKGMAAYTYHANILGYFDDAILAFIYRALTAVSREHTLGELVTLVARGGQGHYRRDGASRHGEQRDLRPEHRFESLARRSEKSRYPDLRPRPQGYRGLAHSNRRNGRRRLHPLGNDSRALLPEAQRILPTGRKLRERVVEPGRGFCQIQRTDHRHLELHHACATVICRPHLHDRPCGLSRRPPYPARREREDRFRRGHRSREEIAASAANRRSDFHRRLRLAPARGGLAKNNRTRESRGRSSASSSSQAATGATVRAFTIARSPNDCRSIRSSSRPVAPSTRS